jgi:hypothetical protein
MWTSIFRIENQPGKAIYPLPSGFFLGWFSALKIRRACFSESSFRILSTRRYISEDANIKNVLIRYVLSLRLYVIPIFPEVTTALRLHEWSWYRFNDFTGFSSVTKKSSATRRLSHLLLESPQLSVQRGCLSRYVFGEQALKKNFIFWNPILFAICTSTFRKLCKNRIQWHVAESSVVLLCY